MSRIYLQMLLPPRDLVVRCPGRFDRFWSYYTYLTRQRTSLPPPNSFESPRMKWCVSRSASIGNLRALKLRQHIKSAKNDIKLPRNVVKINAMNQYDNMSIK